MLDRLRKLKALIWPPLPNDPRQLTYAATSRCPCGAGLAYTYGDTAWDCSEILLGTADPLCLHTDRLPFAFYEIKSEGQPSANGATTRPADG